MEFDKHNFWIHEKTTNQTNMKPQAVHFNPPIFMLTWRLTEKKQFSLSEVPRFGTLKFMLGNFTAMEC
jgi:hypothetical protein